MTKPIEYGKGIVVKELDDKVLLCAESKTRLKEGNFHLEAEEIIIEAGSGVKISSRGHNTLIISCNLVKIEEKIFDFQKEINARLEVLEKALHKILKQVKA